MDRDETPTPRQSGSYAVMQGICEDSIRSLAAWRVKCDAEKWAEVRRFDEKFRKLLAEVRSWEATPPAPAAKACTIEDILGARGEASDWGARWGWSL